jgi:hypothetical protein
VVHVADASSRSITSRLFSASDPAVQAALQQRERNMDAEKPACRNGIESGEVREGGKWTDCVPLLLFIVGLFLAIFFAPLRIIPGGPFLSLVGEIVPICLFTASVVFTLIGFGKRLTEWRVVACCASFASAACIGLIIREILEF